MTIDGWGIERAVADALGGFSGGWSFWRAGLESLAAALERSREREGAFCHYPAGELRRFGGDLVDALELLTTAARVQEAINADGHNPAESIAEVLRARVRELSRDSDELPTPPA